MRLFDVGLIAPSYRKITELDTAVFSPHSPTHRSGWVVHSPKVRPAGLNYMNQTSIFSEIWEYFYFMSGKRNSSYGAQVLPTLGAAISCGYLDIKHEIFFIIFHELLSNTFGTICHIIIHQ